MKKRFLALIFAALSLVSTTAAQQAEVTIQLNEPFFDALLDAIFKNTNGLEFGIAANNPKSQIPNPKCLQ